MNAQNAHTIRTQMHHQRKPRFWRCMTAMGSRAVHSAIGVAKTSSAIGRGEADIAAVQLGAPAGTCTRNLGLAPQGPRQYIYIYIYIYIDRGFVCEEMHISKLCVFGVCADRGHHHPRSTEQMITVEGRGQLLETQQRGEYVCASARSGEKMFEATACVL